MKHAIAIVILSAFIFSCGHTESTPLEASAGHASKLMIKDPYELRRRLPVSQHASSPKEQLEFSKCIIHIGMKAQDLLAQCSKPVLIFQQSQLQHRLGVVFSEQVVEVDDAYIHHVDIDRFNPGLLESSFIVYIGPPFDSPIKDKWTLINKKDQIEHGIVHKIEYVRPPPLKPHSIMSK